MTPPQYIKGRPSPWKVQWREGGKLRSQSFADKRLAQEFEHAKRIERQATAHGLENPSDETLFFDYAGEWIRRRKAGENTKSHVAHNASRLRNYWLVKFGKRPLKSIRSSEIKEHLDWIQFHVDESIKKKAHSAADRNQHRAMLHKLFQDAMLEGKVLYNPVSRVPLVKASKPKWRAKPIQDDEALKVYVGELGKVRADYAVLAEIMLWTGARIGTASALQWRDLESDRIRIRRLIDKEFREVCERQKGEGEGGETIVPYLGSLRSILEAHRGRSKYTRPTDFIACEEDGGFVRYERYHEAHEAALKVCGAKFTPHSFRATFARRAQNAGFTKAEVKELGGWVSMAMVDRYVGKDADHLIDKAAKIGFGSVKLASIKGGRR
jgi:integrase